MAKGVSVVSFFQSRCCRCLRLCIIFTTLTLLIHRMLVYLSKFCKSIVVYFSWDDWKKEKSETNYKFWGWKGVLWAICKWWINRIKSILIKSNLYARVLKSIRQLCKLFRMFSSIDTKIVFHFPSVDSYMPTIQITCIEEINKHFILD